MEKPSFSKLYGIENKPKRIKITSNFASLSDVKIAGSLINQGFPFSVLAKCLQFFEKKCEENFEKVIRLDNWFPNRTWHQE